jgi:SPX domain protein involved in polyphosphate accumulation
MNEDDLQRWANTLDHNQLVNIIVQFSELLYGIEVLAWDSDEYCPYLNSSGRLFK